MADLGVSPIAAETAMLMIARVLLFYFCRTFLLRSLYQDLRHLQNTPLTLSLLEPHMELVAPSTPHATSPPLSPDPRLRQTLFTVSEGSLHDVEDQSLPLPTTAPRQSMGRYLKWVSFRRGPSKTLSATHGEGSLQSTLARTVFAICFSESCILFLLVMCQALRIFGPNTRTLNWNLSLSLLVGLILLGIPLLQCIFITYRPIQSSPANPGSERAFRRFIRRIALTSIPYSLYLFGVHRIPVPEALSDAGLTIRSLSRLAVVGVIILGLISGYGSISTAWLFFQDIVVVKSSGSSLRIHINGPGSVLEPTSAEIASAELSLTRIRSDLHARRQEVERRTALASADVEGSSSGGWMNKLFNKSGDSVLPGIQREIVGLEALEIEMTKDLQELKSRKARIRYSKTFRGKVWRSIGWVFGFYCALRVLSSIFNLIFPGVRSPGSSTPPDFLTSLVVQGLSLLPVESLHLSHEQVVALARQGSLIMVGGMVLVSVRGILRGIGQVLRFTTGVGKSNSGAHSPSANHSSTTGMSSSRSLVANFMLLVLAQVMGVYLLSTLIQLRLSFPPSATTHPTQSSQTVSSETSLFASLPSYEVFNSLFDWTFLISASLTAFGRWIGGKVGL